MCRSRSCSPPISPSGTKRGNPNKECLELEPAEKKLIVERQNPAGVLDAGAVELVVKMHNAFTSPYVKVLLEQQTKPIQATPEVAQQVVSLRDWSGAQSAEWVKGLGSAFEPYYATFLSNGKQTNS